LLPYCPAPVYRGAGIPHRFANLGTHRARSAQDAAQVFAKSFSSRNFHAIQTLDAAEQGFFALPILLPSALRSSLNACLFSAVCAARGQTESVLRVASCNSAAGSVLPLVADEHAVLL
jgi:hypothetical protein